LCRYSWNRIWPSEPAECSIKPGERSSDGQITSSSLEKKKEKKRKQKNILKFIACASLPQLKSLNKTVGMKNNFSSNFCKKLAKGL